MNRASVIVLAAGAAAHWALYLHATSMPVQPAPPLDALPARLGAWVATGELPIAPDIRAVLDASQLLSRRYRHEAAGAYADLFVSYFGSQDPANLVDREPHLPTVCLPAAGWTIASHSLLQGGTANLLRVEHGGDRRTVVYWHQSARRTFANHLWSRWYLPLDRWGTGRNDILMARVILPAGREPLDAFTAFSTALGRWLSFSFPGGMTR